MSLLLDERMLYSGGELLLSSGPLEVWCQVTVEWLRGIAEPTWYGYFIPLSGEVRVLPGRYRLRMRGEDLSVLVRRATRLGGDLCFPFWGLDGPPEIPTESALATPTPPR